MAGGVEPEPRSSFRRRRKQAKEERPAVSVADLLARQPDGGAGLGPAPIVRVADLIARQAEDSIDDGLPVPRRADAERTGSRDAERTDSRDAQRTGSRDAQRTGSRDAQRTGSRDAQRTGSRERTTARPSERRPDRGAARTSERDPERGSARPTDPDPQRDSTSPADRASERTPAGAADRDRAPARPTDPDPQRDPTRPTDRASERTSRRPTDRDPERTSARPPDRTPERRSAQRAAERTSGLPLDRVPAAPSDPPTNPPSDPPSDPPAKPPHNPPPDRPYDPLSDPLPDGLLDELPDRPPALDELPERPPARMDDTDQLILGGAPVGAAMTDQYRLDDLASALSQTPSALDRPSEALGGPHSHPLGPAALDDHPLGFSDDERPTELVARITSSLLDPNLGTGSPGTSSPGTGSPGTSNLGSGVGLVPPVRPDREIVAKVCDALSDSGLGLEGDSAHDLELRTRKIDESLVRLTAIHAGLGADMTARVSASSTRLAAVSRKDPRGSVQGGDGNGPPDDDQTALGRGPDPRFKAGRILVAALAVLLFVISGTGWGAKNWLNAKLHQIAALDTNSDSIVDKAGQYGDENYLLVGSDSRAGIESGTKDAAEVGNENTVPGARSDTVMVAHIPAKRDRVVLVSFPRDLQVDRPSCDRWDAASQSYPGGTSPAQEKVKLNSAFEVGGPQCVTKVVQKLTGLSINHFTAIDFAGFKEMVDSVQGVPICLDRPVIDSVLGRVVPTAGETTLVGEQALAFVRARHVRGDATSDYGRIERQQRFLSALLRKALSDQVLLSPAKLRNFVEAFGSHTLSDNAGLDDLTTLAGSLQHLDPANVTFVTVPTTGEANSGGNEVLRKADTVTLFNAVRADEALPGEATAAAPGGPAAPGDDAAPPSASGVAPGDVTLAVRNGSSRSGLANEVAGNLRSVDFEVSRVGDAKGATDGRTVVRYSPDQADQAATVEAAVPGAVAQPTPGPAGLLELVLGDDFDGEVKAPVLDRSPKLPSNLTTVNAADDSCR